MSFLGMGFEMSFRGPGGDFGVILELKMYQHLIKSELFQKSADMRLDRAGSIGLRAGPPQIAPKMHKKPVNLIRFRSHFSWKK